MRLKRILLTSAASYLIAATAASAEPISIGSAIFSFLYSAGLPGAIANAIAIAAPYALAAGTAIASSVLNRPKGGAVNPSDAKSTFETSDSSIMEGIGRVNVGGLQAFGNTDGSTRARVVCRLVGPIDAVETYYVGGREVTVELNGDISSPPWSKNGGSWAKWLNKSGDGTETAWNELISLFPDLWTVNHRVRGIAQSLLLWYNPGLASTKYLSLYQNGAPTTQEVVRASLIYDPRSGHTVWTDNGILACPHMLRRDPAFSFDRFDWGLIAEQADKADTLVATLTGTEKRARAWGIWAWESGRADTMQQMLDSIGAEIRLTDEGKIWFELVNDDIVTEIDFTPADGYELSWRSGPEAVERPNVCRVKYYSPERNYELTQLALSSFDDDTVYNGVGWAYVQDEVDRYGPKYLDVELPFCPSSSQAQRIGRRRFLLARGDSGSITTNMVGLAAWGILYGTVELPDLGDVLKVRFDPPRCDDDNGSVEIPFTVWPSLTAWNPSTDECPAPDVIPELGYETDMITPDAPSAVLQITYPDASKELRIGYVLPVQDSDATEANIRTYTAGNPNAYQSMTELSTMAYLVGDFLGDAIDARVRMFNGDDGTYFSAVLHAVVGVDNASCGSPAQISASAVGDATSATLHVTVRAPELRAAAIQLQRKVGIGIYVNVSTANARAGANVILADSYTDLSAPHGGVLVQWRVLTLTSDGTAGPALTYGATITGE